MGGCGTVRQVRCKGTLGVGSSESRPEPPAAPANRSSAARISRATRRREHARVDARPGALGALLGVRLLTPSPRRLARGTL